MKCAKCGGENADGVKFCSGCGGPLSADAAVAAPATGGVDFAKAFQKLGKGGKIAVISFAIGFIGTILPWVSISMSFGEYGGVSASANGLNAWQGVFYFLAAIAGVVTCALYGFGSNPQTAKSVLWGMMGSAGLAVLMVVIMLLQLLSNGGFGLMGFGFILCILAAVGMGLGAFMKAKEDKLF